VRLALVLALAPMGDAWFGADKVKHFFMSAFVQSVTYSTVRATGVDHHPSLVAASAVTAAVGVGKEVRDRKTQEHFSVRDLVWDAAGAGAATWLLDRTER
jgi:putative lipoprotein